MSTADWLLLLLLLWPLTGGYLVALLTVQHLGSICLPWIISSSLDLIYVFVSGGRNVDVPEIGIQNLWTSSFFRGSVVSSVAFLVSHWCLVLLPSLQFDIIYWFFSLLVPLRTPGGQGLPNWLTDMLPWTLLLTSLSGLHVPMVANKSHEVSVWFYFDWSVRRWTDPQSVGIVPQRNEPAAGICSQ